MNLYARLTAKLNAGGNVRVVSRGKSTARLDVVGVDVVDAFPSLPADGGTYIDMGAESPLKRISSSDVNQRGISDCYFLAVLIGLAELHPNYVRTLLQQESPGRWVVYFTRGGIWTRVHVSCLVSSIESAPGADGDYWPDLFETAYAFFKSGADTFASLNYGSPFMVFSDLGLNNVYPPSTVARQLAAVRAGCMLVLCTPASGNPPGTVASHAYGAVANQMSIARVRYRNPWGLAPSLWYDFTDADAAKYFAGGSFAAAMPPVVPIHPVPLPPVRPL